jgi:hypothetical protein
MSCSSAHGGVGKRSGLLALLMEVMCSRVVIPNHAIHSRQPLFACQLVAIVAGDDSRQLFNLYEEAL